MEAGSPLVRSIATAISPYIGETMARSSIETHCKRLGIDASKVTSADVERLLQQLGLGLNVFIGREKSEAVMLQIRKSIGSVR